jgi:hypothetical protein
MHKIILIVVSVILLLTAVSCTSGETEYTPTVTAPAYAQPITEAMLQAMSAGDFQGYCFYISADMALRTTEDIWGYFNDFYKARIGDYISLKLYDVQVEGSKTTVIYKAKYSKADEVTVTIVFVPVGESIAVDYLYLDSPELRSN